MQKRAVAIHDISCVGRCSLTVALPILSAAGVETSVLPTAILSTHTGGFTGYTYRDLTDDMMPIADHWKTFDLHTDAIYTGYLGSFEQLDIVKNIIDKLSDEKTVVLVDPVMADNGVLYAGFSPEFPAGMAKLCAKADIIVPNLTEAALMLGEEYAASDYDKAYIEGLVRRLAALGPKEVVLTGVSLEEGKLGAAAYSAEKDECVYYFGEVIDGYFHGTGDVFGSALLAEYLNGNGLYGAIKAAVDFTVHSIGCTVKEGTQNRFGVAFEEAIPQFIRDLGK